MWEIHTMEIIKHITHLMLPLYIPRLLPTERRQPASAGGVICIFDSCLNLQCHWLCKVRQHVFTATNTVRGVWTVRGVLVNRSYWCKHHRRDENETNSVWAKKAGADPALTSSSANESIKAKSAECYSSSAAERTALMASASHYAHFGSRNHILAEPPPPNPPWVKPSGQIYT